MYEAKPWTLNEKEVEVRKSPYIKNREADLAVSTARIKKFMEDNKEKAFSNNEISNELCISLGTVSNITNRLESIGDIKIVWVRQKTSALSQVFQHKDGPRPAVPKERGKRDAIVNVLEKFKQNPNIVLTKENLVNSLNNTESKIRLSLQILLLNETIKLVGSNENDEAQYQYCEGNKKGIKVYGNHDPNYISLKEFIKERNLNISRKELEKEVDKTKVRLFYSSRGIVPEYLITELDSVLKKLELKKTATKSRKTLGCLCSFWRKDY